jgi:LacI family transcriptional regulator
MAITIHNIAKQLRVSPSSVSRALAGKPGVSDDTRRRVVAYAEKNCFAVSHSAQTTRTGKGNGVILLTPLQRAEIARRRDELLAVRLRENFGQAFLSTFDTAEPIEPQIRMALAAKPLAIIISGVWGQKVDLRRIGDAHRVPILAIDSASDGHDNIILDRAAGTCQMARMFLLAGCQHPIYFQPMVETNKYTRGAGIERAHRELKTTLTADNWAPFAAPVTSADVEYAPLGERMTEELLRNRLVDAIFAFNDLMAVGAARALARFSGAAARAIMLVGFDNLPFAAYLPTSLSTIAYDAGAVIEQACDLLRRRLEKASRASETAVVPMRLIVRESSRLPHHDLLKEIFA